jgi:hypothetical protein
MNAVSTFRHGCDEDTALTYSGDLLTVVNASLYLKTQSVCRHWCDELGTALTPTAVICRW